MSDDNRPFWQKASQVFDERAAEYDSWFEENLLFAIELAALQDLDTEFSQPRVEIGVGTGRFADKLGVAVGVDPAYVPLVLARQRIGAVCQGVAEDLPLIQDGIGTIFILFTLCFTKEPARVLAQVAEVLRPGGHLVIGMIPGSGPWGQALVAKKEAGNPFYEFASFYEVLEVEGWLAATGLRVVEKRSSLYQKPETLAEHETSRPGVERDAGFVVLVARKG